MIVVRIPRELSFAYKRWVFPVFVLTILLFSFAVRIYKLNAIPSIVSHDEIYFLVKAKTISLTGTDPTGTWRPSNFTPANPLFAELPGTVMAFAAKLLPRDPLFAGRLTSAIMGTLLPLVLGGIVFELSKSKRLFATTFLLASLNPWIFQFSRMSFDSFFSLFFYFSGFYVLLRLSGYRQLWAIVPFVLGFFQYQGLKVVFLPFILIAVLPAVLKKNRPAWLFLGIMLIFFAWQVVRISQQAVSSRVSDTIFSHRSDFQLAAGVQQQQSIENTLQRTFVNTYTVMARSAAQAYLASFDPQLLFVHGEARRNPFSVWSLGIFHLLDAPLIVIGLVALWREKRHRVLAWTATLLVLVGPVPSTIQTNDIWIMFRSSLLFLSLVFFAGYGVYVVSKLHRSIFVIVLGGYLLLVAQFFYEYFFRYPIYGTEGKYFAERVLGEYIRRTPKSRTVSVYADEKYFVFLEILLTANLITADTMQELQHSLQSGRYAVANFTVDTACLPSGLDWNTTTVVTDSTTVACEDNQSLTDFQSSPPSAIASLIDSGAIFTVYNDQLCAQQGLGNSLFVRKNVFDFSKLSDQEFCRSFFVSPGK